MKHKMFLCTETKGQIWEGCTAFKKALALAVATNILAKAQRTQELRALAKSSAIETSSQFQGLNLLVADGPEKSWNYHQIAKIAI